MITIKSLDVFLYLAKFHLQLRYYLRCADDMVFKVISCHMTTKVALIRSNLLPIGL